MGWLHVPRGQPDLTYNRIQDIHLRSNLFERWLGLARIEIQTAGGGGRPEMTLEGLQAYADVRDFLYACARRDDPTSFTTPQHALPAHGQTTDSTDLASTLREVAAELHLIRQLIEAERHKPKEPR